MSIPSPASSEAASGLTAPSVPSPAAPSRQADFPIDSQFLARWSPRSYTDQPVSDEVLYTILEAARWAPSGGNLQPWRFLVARTAEERKRFASFILPNNRLWTDHAPVLILLLSERYRPDGEPSRSAAFDTGAAWGSLAHQAHLLGLSTRAVGGYDRVRAREVLQVPEAYELHAVIALGYRGEPEQLPAELQAKELPNGRRPLGESIIEGTF